MLAQTLLLVISLKTVLYKIVLKLDIFKIRILINF